MPSGELLAPSLFTESGVQSVRSTNEADKSENVVSKFLSQPARNYISGSEVSTLDNIVALSTDSKTSTTFRLPGNCDAISSISLTIFNDVDEGFIDFTGTSIDDDAINGAEIFHFIDKLEVRIGNSVFQTLKGADLLARNLTEIPSGSLHTSTILHQIENLQIFNIDTCIFSGSGGYVNSFLQCGAPNQNMNIKIYFNPVSGSSSSDNKLTARLEFLKHSLTSVEREYVNNNLINSVIHSSESVGPFSTNETVGTQKLSDYESESNVNFKGVTSGSTNPISKYVFNINEFRINCSHLLLTCHTKEPKVAGANEPALKILEAQLKIGGAYHGGPYSIGFMRNRALSMLGLTVSNTKADNGLYAIPLGSYKFGTDSIPLSKVHNLQLELIIENQDVTSSGSFVDSDLVITAVGTNILTYSGGSVNIHY